MLVLAGLMVVIASVTSNTAITLRRAWPGAAQTGANYDILLLDDEVRSLTAANALLQALGSGTLTSLGQIAGAANQLPYWTGAGVMAATPLTAAARALLDDADAAAMRTTLGLAFQPSGDAPVNITLPDARLVRMDGAKTAVLSRGGTGHHTNSAVNIDTLLPGAQGLYSSSVNGGTFPPFAPPTSGFWLITTEAVYSSGAGNSILQTAVGYRYNASAANAVVICHRVAAVQDGHWSSWARVYHSRNVVGAVTRTSGELSGAIIERGSNANGEYTRFADGTQICWRATAITTNPATFTGTPVGIDGDKLRIGRWY